AQQLVDQPLRFIASDEFADKDIARRIDRERNQAIEPSKPEEKATTSRRGNRAPGFVRMSETPPLAPERETELFRRLNYLKYEANQQRMLLNPKRPSRKRMDEIEKLLAEADKVRDLLIRSNLRLVISIAKRFTSQDDLFEDLVSEGTVAVMNAVEHFDYQRGFRFSTYATQAVRRCYYRLLAKRAKVKDAMAGSTTEMLDSIPGPQPTNQLTESAVESLQIKMRDILTVLDAREQTIIQARFGMKDLKPAQTLQKIADQLGVCKERVRQLEQRAMTKLRRRASELKLDQFLP
ncbi:MAG: sigma-70 family RNA polymerase sigma factor, partial [Pirellulales bacterium]|nr:sigma-70 family RNA polymerase sigma factor [Pirellulales bacterium]